MMKKQLKRLFAMLLALSMSLALLAGCGDTANDPGGNGDKPGTDQSQPADPGQSQPDDSSSGESAKNSEIYPLDCDKTFTVATASVDANDKYCAELWKTTTGVDVNWVTWDGEQTKLALSTGELPDAIRYGTGITKEMAYEYGSAGQFVNYADYQNALDAYKSKA